jgi:hypothetical protein
MTNETNNAYKGWSDETRAVVNEAIVNVIAARPTIKFRTIYAAVYRTVKSKLNDESPLREEVVAYIHSIDNVIRGTGRAHSHHRREERRPEDSGHPFGVPIAHTPTIDRMTKHSI